MIDGQEEPLELTSEATEQDLQAEVVETEEAAEVEGEETEATQEQPKGKSVQERIDEIYGKQKNAEREAEYWRSIALGSQTAKQPEATPEPPKRPEPGDYELGELDSRYVDDLIEYRAKEIVGEQLRQFTEQQTVSQQARELDQAYATHLAAAKAELPDYDEKVTKAGLRGEWPCSEQLAGLIKSSPAGPKVAYHLATNVEDAIALNKLPPIQQAAAFGMIAAQYVAQPAPQPNIATKAPAPAPARTKGGQFAASGELRDDLSQSDWLARRNAQVRGA